MGMIEYTVTTLGVEEFLDAIFAAGRRYGIVEVIAQRSPDELARRRRGSQQAVEMRTFRFRPELVQLNPSDFFITAQEVEEDGGAMLHIGIHDGQIIISMVAGKPDG